MKICMISVVMPRNNKGGIGDYLFVLCKKLAKMGNKVTVITAASPDKEYEETEGFKIYYLKKAKTKKFIKHYPKEWKKESLKKFIELHKKEKFDIVHSQECSALHFLKKKINKKYHVPIVVTLHTTVYDDIKTRLNMGLSLNTFIRDILSYLWCSLCYWPKSYFLEELRLANLSDGMICTSNEQEKIMKSIYYLKSNKLFKVYNGIDADLFKPRKKDNSLLRMYGIKNDEKIILCIARLEVDKGIQFIIKAMPKIKKIIKKVKLVIVGDGSYAGYLRNLAKKTGSKNILFTGFAEMKEIPSFLNICDVFVNSTIRQNGYDIIMVEAMACEKVVISSNIGSTPTLIKENKDGILFTTKDINELIKKVNFILNNKELAKKIGKSARKKVLNTFTSEIAARKTIKVYKKVVENVKKETN